MIKVLTNNGDILEVTPNVAHGMIERGEAVIFTSTGKMPKKIEFEERSEVTYSHRMMSARKYRKK
jgi:hypothetical protein